MESNFGLPEAYEYWLLTLPDDEWDRLDSARLLDAVEQGMETGIKEIDDFERMVKNLERFNSGRGPDDG